MFIFRVTHQMEFICVLVCYSTFLLAEFLDYSIFIWDRGFCIMHAFGTNELLWFINAVPLPFLKSFNIYINNGTFFTRKALIVFFCWGGLFFRESYQRQEWQSQSLRTVKIIEMHLKYQVIGTNFVDAICHGDEKQLTITILVCLFQRADV